MHHRTTTTAVTLILIACLLLTGCSAEALQKNRLRQDPLYTATWDGIEFLGTEESADGTWKPPPPSITRCFTTTLPPEEAVQRIMTTAEQENWTEDESTPRSGTSRWAQKRTRGGMLRLYVSESASGCMQYPETNLIMLLGVAVS